MKESKPLKPLPRAIHVLARYGRHDFACELKHDANLPGDPRCTCGFSKAQVEVETEHRASVQVMTSLHLIASMTSPGVLSCNAERLFEVAHAEAELAIARAAIAATEAGNL